MPIPEGNIHAFVGINSSYLQMEINGLVRELGFDPGRLGMPDNGIREIAWDEKLLAAPCDRLYHDDELDMAHTGWGLAAVLEQISVRYPGVYEDIHGEMKHLFRMVKEIRVVPRDKHLLELEMETRDPITVPAKRMSRGILYCLGFSVLALLGSRPLMLVYRPEAGLHPAMIDYVMAVLKEVASKGDCRVWITTNNSFVIDHLEAHQVSVLKEKPDGGCGLELLCDTPDFDKSDGFSNGDYWVSFCSQEGYFR